MGATLGGNAAKSGKNTILLVIMRVGLLEKIGPLNLTNRTGLKKVNR